MPRLSAIDAINPALGRVNTMLFRPFRFKTWLKIGFIGWLAGSASSANFNYNAPNNLGSGSNGSWNPDIRAFLNEHMLVIVGIVAFAIAIALVFIYLSCRFRFILFDSVLQTDAQIRRGWEGYRRQGHRYLGFTISLIVVSVAVLAVIVGLPLWNAYKSGIFQSGNPFPAILRIFVPILLGVFAFVIVSAIITSLANDFTVPLLALDDMTIGDAWSVLRRMIASEPGAFAGYLGMKLLLSIAAAIAVAIPMIIVFLILAIPVVIVAVLVAGIIKALGGTAAMVLGIGLGGIGVLVLIGGVLMIVMFASAPVVVFFTSYSLYFFGGRYPKLGTALWPEPPAPVAPPPLVPPPPLPSPGAGPVSAPV